MTVPGPFEFEFMQRALLEIVLLAPLSAVLGTQIALRRLAFYAHGVGTATFPGLVVAGPLGIPPAVAALAVAGAFAAALGRLGRAARLAHDSATALLLVGALAVGIVLASDVFESGAGVDQLLFGSLLAIGTTELAVTAGALVVGLAAAAVWRRAWIADGFEPGATHALGLRAGLAEWGLLGAIAVAVVASLDAVGALLVGAILVIPAVTARLVAGSVRGVEVVAGALALVEGAAALWIAYELDAPPGAVLAVLGGAVFAVVAGARQAGLVRTP